MFIKYAGVYENLTTNVLNNILDNKIIDKGQRLLIRLIANLPHPSIVTYRELEYLNEHLVENFDKVSLENVAEYFTQVNSSNMLSVLNDLKQRNKEPDYEEYRYDSNLLRHTNMLAGEILHSMSTLIAHTDLNLKARCPYCKGDLILLVDDSKQANKGDLWLF